MRHASAIFVLSSAGLFGCINTDPAIYIDVEVSKPTLAVEQQALGAKLTGGFTLSLHLGARAADSSEVSLQAFDLLSEDKNTVVYDGLPLVAPGQAFPIVVEPDTTIDVDLQVDTGTDLIPKSDGDTICSFGVVRYQGSLDDSLRETGVPILTGPFPVDCP